MPNANLKTFNLFYGKPNSSSNQCLMPNTNFKTFDLLYGKTNFQDIPEKVSVSFKDDLSSSSSAQSFPRMSDDMQMMSDDVFSDTSDGPVRRSALRSNSAEDGNAPVILNEGKPNGLGKMKMKKFSM